MGGDFAAFRTDDGAVVQKIEKPIQKDSIFAGDT